MQDNPRAMARLRELLRARRPLYARAHLRVDTSTLPAAGVVDAVAGAVAAVM
jgi:hypothetical protein